MIGDVVARTDSRRGELMLRRRGDGVLELRVNGIFVMDTQETGTERELAVATLGCLAESPHDPGGFRILVGGLGLGFTLDEVLKDARVAHVSVVEIEPALVSWHRAGLVPASPLLDPDPRVEVTVADVADFVASAAEASFDAVVLDVDNGPGFLVYDENAALYGAPYLRACRRVLADGGVLTVWSSGEEPQLDEVIGDVFGTCDHRNLPVTLGTRETAYHLFIGRGHDLAAPGADRGDA